VQDAILVAVGQSLEQLLHHAFDLQAWQQHTATAISSASERAPSAEVRAGAPLAAVSTAEQHAAKTGRAVSCCLQFLHCRSHATHCGLCRTSAVITGPCIQMQPDAAPLCIHATSSTLIMLCLPPSILLGNHVTSCM